MYAKSGAIIVAGLFISLGLTGLAWQETRMSEADQARLAFILKSAREYCAKLERAALDFVCLEEVEEKLDLSRDDRKLQERAAAIRTHMRPGDIRGLQSRLEIHRNPKFDNIYLYDYQLVRRGGKIEEKRLLLEMNGKKASPETPRQQLSAFNYSDILLAPIQLLDAEFEPYYFYKLLGKTFIARIEAWVLEVTPRVEGVSRYLGGKIWLKSDDGSVLRIEWDPTTFGHFEQIQARAEAYKAVPEVRSSSEYAVEKNGLRFPSSDFTEEAYRGANKKLFVRARTIVTYRDHKFFTVETFSTLKK